jgi:hypothetical protein
MPTVVVRKFSDPDYQRPVETSWYEAKDHLTYADIGGYRHLSVAAVGSAQHERSRVYRAGNLHLTDDVYVAADDDGLAELIEGARAA